jgi:hypothetical protein
MLKSKSILMGILGLSLLIPAQVLGSFCQPDKATTDKDLIKITNEGSIAFLEGAIKVQQAMQMLDKGDIDGAKKSGLRAVDDFITAKNKFTEAVNLVKQSAKVQTELSDFLRKVNYDQKAVQLGIDRPERSPLWLAVTDFARKGNAIEFFYQAATRAKSKEDLTGSVFKAVMPSPIEGAKLLVQIGMDLAFGAYVSALFAK